LLALVVSMALKKGDGEGVEGAGRSTESPGGQLGGEAPQLVRPGSMTTSGRWSPGVGHRAAGHRPVCKESRALESPPEEGVSSRVTLGEDNPPDSLDQLVPETKARESQKRSLFVVFRMAMADSREGDSASEVAQAEHDRGPFRASQAPIELELQVVGRPIGVQRDERALDHDHLARRPRPRPSPS
jgi:hypothetical protein